MMQRGTSPAVVGFVVFSFACTSRNDSPTTGGTVHGDDSSSPSSDDSSADDSSTHADDSSPPDDSSVTSGDIHWTLVDSTDGPISHKWAGCDPHGCKAAKPDVCDGVGVGIVASQEDLETLYAESLIGIDYVPEIDFSSHTVIWSYLCCCVGPDAWLVVDDVTRIGLELKLSMHMEYVKLAPATFGRPWVVVQVPIGDYDGVVAEVKLNLP